MTALYGSVMILYGDLYVVKWLLQVTNDARPIEWHRTEKGTYCWELNEGRHIVRAEIRSNPTRTADEIVSITFSSPGLGEVTIAEPFQKLVGFRLKYENPNDKELAETMKLLFKTVSK